MSPAQQSLRTNLQKNGPKPKFVVAEDAENASPLRSHHMQSPAPLPIISQLASKGKENSDSPRRVAPTEEAVLGSPVALLSTTRAPQWSPQPSTQDTLPDSQEDDDIFSQQQTQQTQPTEPATSFRRSIRLSAHARRDTGDSFVSAKEAFGSKQASKENLRADIDHDVMDVDEPEEAHHSEPQDVNEQHETSPMHTSTPAGHPPAPKQSPRRHFSEQYSISAETQEALDTTSKRAHAPEPKMLVGGFQESPEPAAQHDDTVLHHDVEDHDAEDRMDIEEEDVRSPSDNSSPVKPLVRKSSLTFASLPAREPLIPKKSMGSRVSRTSHVDPSKTSTSQMCRFTGGKSLGGSQQPPAMEAHEDDMDIDQEPAGLQREESESTKMHNKASTKTLKERLNMLNQRTEPPKRISQNIAGTQSQTASVPVASHPSQPLQTSQPTYPNLPTEDHDKEDEVEEDDEDDWISPIKAAPPARPLLSKSYSADPRPNTSDDTVFSKTVSVSNPDLPIAEGSTTPIGSPSNKRYMDAPLSASKAKFYSALRAAKEKIIGSSATSAQVKRDALADAAMRAKLQTHSSSDDVFSSPKRNEKAGTSIFSHLRSPSKESVKSTKSSKLATSSSSPAREERERQREKEKELREKEAKQKQRAEDRLREMREKEQSKATAHYQKTKLQAKTPAHVPSQAASRAGPSAAIKTPGSALQAPQSRPGTARLNTASRLQEMEAADDMAPPPPPKGLMSAGPGQKLREPKRLIKAPSKDTLPKGKPQKIQVNLHRDRFGQAPAPKAPVAAAPKSAAVASSSKQAPPAQKPAPATSSRPAPGSRMTTAAPKPAPRMGRPQPIKAAERLKPAPTQPRADLPSTRPISRMQTVQDATRINVPPLNPAKPPVKRPFQVENDEPLHRPAKRPSQQARSKPVTPAHAQFAQGKIPFAEPAPSAQQTPHYPNGEEIELPAIMTDSEDEDSDNDFEQPSWVDTPNLNSMLERQQLVDPEEIFGPIAPLNMEQVFPNKERHKRFRERTSSAYWANDQVTEEERRKEREARERLVREGAWTYNPSPLPGKHR